MSGPVSPEELAQLLDQHGAALELFAAQWTVATDDCVQDAFVQLVRQGRRPDNVVAWLFRVVRNRAISLRRSTMRRQKHELAAAGREEAWFQPQGSGGLDRHEVTRALCTLSDEQREIVVARIWGGLSFEQIAEVVGVSRSTAHRRYEEALQSLRSRLDRQWLTNPLT
jgi:RNA polymerase sigma factor (sigma-70 family)